MNLSENRSGVLTGAVALLSAALTAGCGGGGDNGGVVAAAPMVTDVAPLPNAADVPINTESITAAFTKAMAPATLDAASFTLACPAGTAIVGAVGYLPGGNQATLTLPADLPANALCTARITTAAEDTTGKALAENFVWTFRTGAGPDNIAPQVTATLQANGASHVAINTRVGATFSEPMAPPTITNANFTLRETVAGTPVAGTVGYTGVNAVFTPVNNLKVGTRYTATVSVGAKDLAGNALAGNHVWTWTTAAATDTTAPKVVGTIHADGATDVAINTRVGATFSEGMDPLTITNANFSLKKTIDGTPVAGIVGYAGVGAQFIPLNDLAANTRYTVTLKGGANGVKDLAGNPMAQDFVIAWTTAALADTLPPTTLGTNPANVAIGVCINKTINATFSEAMDPLTLTNANFTLAATAGGNVAGVVTYDAPTRIATFNPLTNLDATTNYTATIQGGVGGVADLAGNRLAADKITAFTTGTTACTAPIALAAATPFGSFGGGAGMTNQGTLTVVLGDIGSTGVSTTMTGFHDAVGDIYTETPLNRGTVNGRIYTNAPPPGGAGVGGNADTFAIAGAAANATLIAYNSMSPASLPGGVDPGAGQLGGLTLFPGIYRAAGGTFLLTGSDLTLDGQGDPNAVWVFQTAAGLTIGAPGFPRRIVLSNGAQAKNVFWYVGSSARIEDRCHMVGTIIASAGVTISTAGQLSTTTLHGRAMGLNASVTMVNTLIDIPAP